MSSDLPDIFVCENCDVVYTTEESLHCHMVLMHAAESWSKKEICLECGKALSGIGSLNRHLKAVHNVEQRRKEPNRTIACGICDKMLATKANLKRHLRLVHEHPEPEEFICSECGHNCSSKNSITRHIRITHPLVHNDDPSALETFLPDGYCYKVSEFNYQGSEGTMFRTKFTFEVPNLAEGLQWMEKFVNKNKLFIRRLKRKSKKKHVLFKDKYICQHNVSSKTKQINVSPVNPRQTFCPWTCFFQIRKMQEEKNIREDTTSALVKILLKHCHNHDESFSLKFRKPTKDVQQQFLELFKSGFRPSEALKIYTNELKSQQQDQYSILVEDPSIVPTKSWAYRYFDRVFKKS